jgi:hypothetical protein
VRALQGREPHARLAASLFVPVVALVLVFVVADATLPGADCDGVSNEPSGLAEGLVLFVTAASSLACLAVAARRLLALRRAGDRTAPLGIALAAIAILVAAILLPTGGSLIVPLFVAGLAATGLSFLALLFVLPFGRTVDEVGVLLSLYLTGMGVFVYPTVLFLFAIGNSGIAC